MSVHNELHGFGELSAAFWVAAITRRVAGCLALPSTEVTRCCCRQVRANRSAHVVVLGNEKGGSGKSTVALPVAVALLKAGQRVAAIDVDCRQQSFTRYINNRIAWARRTGLRLEVRPAARPQDEDPESAIRPSVFAGDHGAILATTSRRERRRLSIRSSRCASTCPWRLSCSRLARSSTGTKSRR